MENIQYYYLPLTQTLLPVLNADGFFVLATPLQPNVPPPREVELAPEPELENVIWVKSAITGRMVMVRDAMGKPVPASAMPGVEDIRKAADWEWEMGESESESEVEEGEEEGGEEEDDDEEPPEGEEFWYLWKDGHYRLDKEKA